MRKVTLAFLLVLLFPYLSLAQSLWKDGFNLYGDKRASSVGDIVYVLIEESATMRQKATTKTSKNASLDASQKGISFLKGPLPANLNAKGSYDGSDETNRSTTFYAVIAAKIVEVLPNGNLVIEGEHYFKGNKDTVKIIVKGMIRPEDISSDNTVSSTKICDAEIIYSGTGVFGSVHQPGILTQIFHLLF
ncbi:MAG: flagellar basal body L-ring protein FlgH [Synergistetes bacterium]|nr:flagellar basal body L-ring protein FlgH [Synergistota bacterium]MDW8192952.1 flagellar basal body L-ring protein FlgH [Synergistota bacterium]